MNWKFEFPNSVVQSHYIWYNERVKCIFFFGENSFTWHHLMMVGHVFEPQNARDWHRNTVCIFSCWEQSITKGLGNFLWYRLENPGPTGITWMLWKTQDAKSFLEKGDVTHSKNNIVRGCVLEQGNNMLNLNFDILSLIWG